MKTPCILFLCCFQKHEFELKNLLRVICRNEKITTGQTLKYENNIACFFEFKNYKASDFGYKNLSTCQILYQLLTTLQILIWTSYNVSDFKSTFWIWVIFWIEKLTLRQILFGKKIFQRGMFWIDKFSSC